MLGEESHLGMQSDNNGGTGCEEINQSIDTGYGYRRVLATEDPPT